MLYQDHNRHEIMNFEDKITITTLRTVTYLALGKRNFILKRQAFKIVEPFDGPQKVYPIKF